MAEDAKKQEEQVKETPKKDSKQESSNTSFSTATILACLAVAAMTGGAGFFYFGLSYAYTALAAVTGLLASGLVASLYATLTESPKNEEKKEAPKAEEKKEAPKADEKETVKADLNLDLDAANDGKKTVTPSFDAQKRVQEQASVSNAPCLSACNSPKSRQ